MDRSKACCSLVVIGILIMTSALKVYGSGAPASGWGEAEIIELEDKGSSLLPDIGIDGAGNAIAVWEYDNDGTYVIMTNRYVPGIGWGNAEAISVTTEDALDPAVAVLDNGNAIVVWRQYFGSYYNILASHYTIGIGWGAPISIESLAGESWEPSLEMDEAGNALVLWPQVEVGGYFVSYNLYSVGFGWRIAEYMEENVAHDTQIDLDLSPTGDAIAVWHQRSSTNYDIWSNHFNFTDGWGIPELLETNDDGDALNPNVDVSASGDAIAVWMQRDGPGFSIMSNNYTNGTGWGGAFELDDDDTSGANNPDIAVDRNGGAIATWQQWDGVRYDIYATRLVPGMGWGSPEPIEDLDGDTDRLSAWMDASGNCLVLWVQYDGAFKNLLSRSYSNGTGWGDVSMVEAHVGNVQSQRAAFDRSGNAIIVWYQMGIEFYDIWSNRYTLPDTSPPDLTISSPTEGTVTSVPTVTVSGVTEPGATVNINGALVYVDDGGSFSIEVALMPGPNLITVSSKDPSGNTAMGGISVTYNDPVPGLVENMTSLRNLLMELNSSLDLTNDEVLNISSILSAFQNGTNVTASDIASLIENITELKDALNATGDGNETLMGVLSALEARLEGTEDLLDDLKEDQDDLRDEVASLDDDDDEEEDGGLTTFVYVLFIINLLLFLILGFLVVLLFSRKGGRDTRIEDEGTEE